MTLTDILDGAMRTARLRAAAVELCKARGLKLTIWRGDSLYQATVTFESKPGHYWSVVAKVEPPEKSEEAMAASVAAALDAWLKEHGRTLQAP
jgi:hypothetical protein